MARMHETPSTLRIGFSIIARLAAALALPALGAGCRSHSPEAAPFGGPKQSPTAVEFSATRLTLAEIERPIAHELFELRSMAANDRVLNELIHAEAKRRGISLERLLIQETVDKVPPRPEAELRAAYDKERAEREQTMARDPGAVALAMQSFDEFKADPRNRATPAETRVLQQRFFNRLMDSAHVRMHLDVLGRPEPLVAEGGPSRGPRDAKVTIIEYTDFANPFCAQAQSTIEKLLVEFPKDVRVLFRQDPQPEHPSATVAAQAALCADDQGRYWQYRKQLFTNQQALEPHTLIQYALDLGLNVDRFSKCLDSGAKAGDVERDIAEARRNDLAGSPVFLVNGTRLSGAHELQTFRRLIDFELPKG